MLTAEENHLLTRVEGDAPMGRLMRQHWTPVCLVEEVDEPDGTPLLVEALGQRMVAFRDSKGRLGLLNEKCPHRKASLLLGRNEDCGLRCLYHGWKYAVDGRCVAMHTEPEDSGLIGKVRARAWPVVEWAGLVWAWLGEPGAAPPFDPPAFAPRDDIATAILKIRVPCNLGADPRRPDRQRALLQPARHRHGAGTDHPPPRPAKNPGTGPQPTSLHACRSSARATDSTTSPSAGRSGAPPHTSICA